MSRLLSGVGYHQPPIYYLPAFKLKDDFGTHVEVGGRFRLKDKTLKDTGPWKWEDNPFVGTKPFEGLIVLLMMFNSTDLKDQNNTLYEHRDGDMVQQWYVARDLGAALGDVHPWAPRKSEPDAFEHDAVHPRRQQWLRAVRLWRLVQEPRQGSDHARRRRVGLRLLGRLSEQQFRTHSAPAVTT